MKFEDLEAFVHVAQQQGFSRAASQMRVAQSALSRRVTRLEHQLGVQLLWRHGRGVQLTEHGTALLERASGLMAELKSIRSDLLAHAVEPRGEVSIALTPTAAQVLVPRLVLELRRDFPQIKLAVREGFSGFIHGWVAEGGIDLAMLYDPEPNAELEIVPLLNEPLYLVAPRERAGLPELPLRNGHVPVRALGALPLILPSHAHSLRSLLERLAAERRFALDVVNEIDGMRAIKGMVEAGLGYTVFSYAGVYEEVNAGTLEIIPLAPRLGWKLALVERKLQAQTRALAEVRRIILRQIHVLHERGFWQGDLCAIVGA